MTQDMPEISYERSMNHNYMVLSKYSFFGQVKNNDTDYRTRMILENNIPGLLPVTHRLVNGENRYYYEINSLQSLDRLYEKNEIQYSGLKKLLSGFINLFDKLDEYLLDGTQIIIKSELIYINVEKMQPYFVCYPDYEGDVRIAFMEFIDELLTKIDHTDEQAVMLGYQIYRYTRNPNYVISEIGNLMEQMALNIEKSYKTQDCWNKNTLKSEKTDNYDKLSKYDEYTGIHMQNLDSNNENILENNKKILDYDKDALNNNTEYSDYENIIYKANKSKKYKIGGISSIAFALCMIGIIIIEKVFKIFYLSNNSELYLFGAIAMAIVAAGIFLLCYIKENKANKIIDKTYSDNSNIYDKNINSINTDYKHEYNNTSKYKSECSLSSQLDYQKQNLDIGNNIYTNKTENIQKHITQNETVCLGNGIVEERILYGKVKGEDINILLDKLPITIGTLENVADFILNDTTVSKMHARFEERNGRVCICDLNSTNGTIRNGKLLNINQPVTLEVGDRIRIGRTNFIYC